LIALIDYGAGNLTSVKKALAAVGADVFVPVRPEELTAGRGIVVPGVGHFGATRALGDAWVGAIRTRVDEGCPLLGICLGMQWLYEASDEAPELKGLGVFPGRVVRLHGEVRPKAAPYENAEVRLKPDAPSGQFGDSGFSRTSASQYGASGFSRTFGIKVPHVGWNSLALVRDDSVIAGVAPGAQVYYTHSYVAPVTADTAAVTEHGQPFAAVVQRGRIAGVQFHPEKSGDVGLRVLKNFLLLTSNF
jgi:imidazole glycerol-phosphate synthase subunit HisH